MSFTCKTCSKNFTQLRNLTRHEKTVHREKIFVCDKCSESFTRKDALKRHQKRHQRIVTHSCDNCRKEFYRRDNLVEHQVQCQGKPLKRGRDEDDNSPAPKKMRVQIGEGESDSQVEENDNPCSSTSAFEDSLKKIELKPRKDQRQDMSHFLRGKTKSILSHLSGELVKKMGIKWFISVKVRFIKPKPDGEDVTTETHFRSLCTKTVNQHELHNQLEEAKQKITQSLVLFQKEGSGWVLDEILHLDLSIAEYTPVKGSSYIPLPSKLKTKKAIINIKNSDNKCFMWSVLAALHPPSQHVDRLRQYQQFQDELDFTGIEFPVTIDKFGKFERQNNISINVFGFEDVLFPLYITKEHFDTHVNLLLYSQGTTRHYCLIKDLNKFLHSQNRKKARMYYCRYCLHGFIREDLLQDHEPHCCQHGPQRVELPNEDNAFLFFKDYQTHCKMADSRSEYSSDLNDDILRNDFDLDKIKVYIESKSVIYDGERVKWCENYEALQEFVNTVFCQQGKWWFSGGSARRFDASTSDLIVIWYPGKLNTLTLKGEHGILAREYLIDHSESPHNTCEDPVKPCETCRGHVDDDMDNAMLEIEILKSRFDAMKFVHDSLQEEPLQSMVSNLSNEMKLLQLDLEEEKFKNTKLELEIKYLREEINIIKSSLSNGTTRTIGNTKANHEHDKNTMKNIIDSVESTNESRKNEVARVGLVDHIDKQIHDYRSKQHNKYHLIIEGQTQFEQTTNIETENDAVGVELVEQIDKQMYEYRSKQQTKYHLTTEGQSGQTANTEMENDRYGLPQKASTLCPFLKRRGRCLKGHRCDFSHPKTFQTRKRDTPCPFLRKRGYCLKKNKCDFSHGKLLHHNSSPTPRLKNQMHPEYFLADGRPPMRPHNDPKPPPLSQNRYYWEPRKQLTIQKSPMKNPISVWPQQLRYPFFPRPLMEITTQPPRI